METKELLLRRTLGGKELDFGVRVSRIDQSGRVDCREHEKGRRSVVFFSSKAEGES